MSKQSHVFNVSIAEQIGLHEAIILEQIKSWSDKSRRNGINEHEGLFWSRNSVASFCEQFSYFSEKQVRSILKNLEEKGYILSNHFGDKQDRTKWYAVTMKTYELYDERPSEPFVQKGKCNLPKGQMDLYKRANDIPILSNINNNINIDIGTSKKFNPPSIEEVRQYCTERKNQVDPEKWHDYYLSNGWRVGKNPMKDWRAAVRTWERNEFNTKINEQPKRLFHSDFD